ncbi:MAG TPA: hypothetical protein VKZ79_18835 [Alphaproteobacteria bacterium]|nr:hypothetical protein [Alphaproteobacteria bacterium]
MTAPKLLTQLCQDIALHPFDSVGAIYSIATHSFSNCAVPQTFVIGMIFAWTQNVRPDPLNGESTMNQISIQPSPSRYRQHARTSGSTIVATTALLLGFSVPARATVFFTATETTPAAIHQTAVLGNFLSFGFEQTTVSGECTGCLSASAGDGTPLGIYGFTVSSLPFNYITDPASTDGFTQSAIPSGGSYFEHYAGYGNFGISTGASNLLGGGANYFGLTVWATPGSTTATMEFDINGDPTHPATSNVIDLPSEPLYLDVTGTTTAPVALTDLTPGQTPDFMSFTDPLTVDFTITLSDTPFSPSVAPPPTPGSGSDLPEPWTSAVMISGLLALGFARRVRPLHLAQSDGYRTSMRRFSQKRITEDLLAAANLFRHGLGPTYDCLIFPSTTYFPGLGLIVRCLQSGSGGHDDGFRVQ